MKKRLLSILLVFVLCVSLLPVTAFAAGGQKYNLWIGGEQVTSANLTGTAGSGTWSFDPAASTLTLDNASIVTDEYSGISVTNAGADEQTIGELTIVVKGESSIKTTYRNANTAADGVGINVAGDVTIKGYSSGASLKIEAGMAGISSFNGKNIQIENLTVNAVPVKSDIRKAAVQTMGGEAPSYTGAITLKDSAVTVAEGFNNAFISGASIVVDHSSVTAKHLTGTAFTVNSGNLTIKNGSIIEVAGPIEEGKDGDYFLYAGTIQIEDSEITASTGGAYPCVGAYGNLVITNSTATLKKENPSAISFGGTYSGVWAGNGITITNSQVTVTNKANGRGLDSGAGITITNTSGKKVSVDSVGIAVAATGKTSITGGETAFSSTNNNAIRVGNGLEANGAAMVTMTTQNGSSKAIRLDNASSVTVGTGLKAVAAANTSGSPLVDYVAANNDTYKYVKILSAYTITAQPTEGGTVTGNADTYTHGETVTLTATPNDGYSFIKWTEGGNEVSTEATYTFTATADRSLVAVFSLNAYAINVTVEPTEGGTVDGDGVYIHGETVTLTATPARGYRFVRWTENDVELGTEATLTFNAEADRTLVAVFERELLPMIPIFADELPFEDVLWNDWFYDEVKDAWQNDLIGGVTPTLYKPYHDLTVAQAIKLAAALHQMNTWGKVTLTNGSPNWYDPYVDYAVENGIIEGKYQYYTLAQMNAPVTRREFVHIFCGALPESSYYAWNTVADNAIPDVKTWDACADEIYTFYRAGILTGAKADGSFLPNDNIKRSEVAAILIRMYDQNARQSVYLP